MTCSTGVCILQVALYFAQFLNFEILQRYFEIALFA